MYTTHLYYSSCFHLNCHLFHHDPHYSPLLRLDGVAFDDIYQQLSGIHGMTGQSILGCYRSTTVYLFFCLSVGIYLELPLHVLMIFRWFMKIWNPEISERMPLSTWSTLRGSHQWLLYWLNAATLVRAARQTIPVKRSLHSSLLHTTALNLKGYSLFTYL